MRKETKFYVTMTDKFMSGWGRAKDKINKYVIECNSMDDARTARGNAERRSEMKHINIYMRKPYYDKRKYLTSLVKFENLGECWTNKIN